MGLEMVQIVIEAEDAFGIEISDKDAQTIETVGQFCDHISNKLNATKCTKCLSSMAFYRLRRGLGSQFGVSRGCVAPASSMEELVPHTERRSHWEELAQVLGMNLPPLKRSDAVEWAISGGAVAILIASIVASIQYMPADLPYKGWLGFAAGTLIMALFVAKACRLTMPLATVVPRHAATVKGLVDWMIIHNAATLAAENHNWTEQQVFEVVKAIAIETLQINEDEVIREAKWVNDLGAG